MGLGFASWRGSALVGALCVAGAAHAQSAPAIPRSAAQPSREQLHPGDQAPPPAARNRDLFSAPLPLPCPLVESKVNFRLEQVEISGTSVPPETLRPAYADLLGATIPVSSICEIRDRLSLILFRRGLLARVEAPPQTITGGRLKLVVVEARIVAVRVHGDIGPAQDKVEAYLDKLRGLAPFDLKTAQRYLLLANETPGVRISAALRPSTAGLGAIDLDVQVTRTPVDAVVAVQNTGSASLGPWGALARVDLNSFTRFGERTSLIAYHTVPDDEQWIVELIEEARLGSSGLVGRASVSYGVSHPGDVLQPLALRGESVIFTPELSYPLIKLKRYQLDAGAGLDVVDQKTAFPGGDLLADDKLRVAWAELAGQFQTPLASDRLQLAGRGSLQVRKGLSILGASAPGDPALSRIAGEPEAWVLRFEGEGQLATRFGAVGLRTQAQYADQPLLSYEQMAVGDLTIGRGYEAAVLAGDRVAAAELKLAPPELRLGPWARVTPFVYGDASCVQTLGAGAANRTLRSAGVGFEARFPAGVRTSITWAHPFDKPYPAQPEQPGDRVLFQLVAVR